uniref:CUB domain-containing protein n=1 Tax=Ciona savignyi TaxID=51511 RepID=H2ZN49_CIOSA
NGDCAQRCISSGRSRTCTCATGFNITSDRRICSDFNECAVNNGGCEETCINLPGSYWCTCREGYKLAPNRQSCIPKEENACSEYERRCEHFCVIVSSRPRCACRHGYRRHRNGRNCIRLCTNGNGGCDHICQAGARGMSCSCRRNYVLASDGRTCSGKIPRILEFTVAGYLHLIRRKRNSEPAPTSCAVENGGCSEDCDDSPIGVQCSCPSGHVLQRDGRSCRDINECLVDNGGCEHGCRNNVGSYICNCSAGFKLGADERTCVDIDECQLDDTCWHGCVNSIGSFECTCPLGFRKYSIARCGDINECTTRNGGCSHICRNKPGGFVCSCMPGYKLHINGKDCVRETSCINARSEPEITSSIKCISKNCLFQCKGESTFRVYSRPRAAGYTYMCGKVPPQNPRSRRGKRISPSAVDAAGYVWQNRDLHVNETLPICPGTAFLCIFCTPELFIAIQLIGRCNQTRIAAMVKRINGMLRKSLKKQALHFSAHRAYLKVRRKSMNRRRPAVSPGIRLNTRCLIGSVESSTTCSPCEAGTYFDISNTSCTVCPSNTYQEKKGQLECMRCPTNATGSTVPISFSQCPGLCPPGHFSVDGLQPCQSCPTGTYQYDHGRIGCYTCGEGITTRQTGSTSFSDCLVRGSCTAGHYYNSRTGTCNRCPNGFYQPGTGQDFCVTCPGNTTTDYDASTTIDACKETRCGGVIGNLHGVIESPNYPGNYPINSHCTWVLRTPKRRKLLVVVPEIFLPFDDNCGDYLIMKTTSSKVVFQSCQKSQNPKVLMIKSKRLWIEFRSNGSNGAKGFQIPYVTYNQDFDKIIAEIVKDGLLYAPEHHQNILKYKLTREALLEVLADPRKYYPPNEKTEYFPKSFLKYLRKKVEIYLKK